MVPTQLVSAPAQHSEAKVAKASRREFFQIILNQNLTHSDIPISTGIFSMYSNTRASYARDAESTFGSCQDLQSCLCPWVGRHMTAMGRASHLQQSPWGSSPRGEGGCSRLKVSGHPAEGQWDNCLPLGPSGHGSNSGGKVFRTVHSTQCTQVW